MAGERGAIVLATLVVLSTTMVGPATAESQPLLVADVSALTLDEQLVFTALQGMVNRSGPRIYLTGLRDGQDYIVDLTAEKWLRDAVPLPTREVPPYDLLKLFRSEVKGLVVWDPNLRVDTQNLATTMAGLHDWLPVSPALSGQLQAAYHFPVTADLRSHGFQNRADAYSWALTQLGPLSQFSHLAWLGDVRNGRAGHGLRDWIVARRGFAFEGDPKDDWQIVTRVLDSFPAGMQVFGYPFFDDAFYKATGLADNESIGVGEISRSAKQLIPSHDATNLTVHSSFAPIHESPPWDDTPEKPPADNTTYVAFLISDGDNIGYNIQGLRSQHWDNPTRKTTKIPVGVSISSRLVQYAPRVYDFYVHTLTDKQVFVAGPSGAGYIYPQFHPALPDFLAETKGLLDCSGLRAVWILDNGYLASPSPLIVLQYADVLHPSAVFADYGGYVIPNPPPVSVAGNVPVVHAMWATDVQSTVPRIKLAAQSYPGQPAFVLVALATSTMGFDQAEQLMQGLGPGFVAVRPDRFIGLVKGAGLLPGTPPGITQVNGGQTDPCAAISGHPAASTSSGAPVPAVSAALPNTTGSPPPFVVPAAAIGAGLSMALAGRVRRARRSRRR